MLAEGGSMAAGLKNHYQVLGLSPGATGEEIKQAYRQQLAHFRAAMTSTERPDPVQLDQLRAAFSTLSDPATRQVYDAHLRAANGFAASTPTPDLLINDEAGQASRVKSAAAEPPPQAEPQTPPNSASRQVLHFEFVGSGQEYFRIWIVNLCLTVLTLGIYSAWAKVRRETYFHRNLLLDGSAFDYHGRASAILRGRAVAFGLLLGVSFAQRISPYLHTAALLALMLAAPWLIVRALSFRAYNTSYRGLRFGFAADVTKTYKTFLINLLLVLITLGLYFPRMVREIRKFIIDHASFGRTNFCCDVTVKEIYIIFVLPFLALLMLGLFAAMAGVKAAIGSLLVGIMLLYLGMPAYLGARLSNAIWSATRLGRHRFACRLPLAKYIATTLGNWFMIAVTLGLYTPWARVRMAKLRAEHMDLTVFGDLEDFLAAESQRVSAFGEEGAEMFDMDISL